MKLYLVSRTDKWDYYNEYDSFVVVAENEESAKSYHPIGYKKDHVYQWTNNRDNLIVEYLGESNSKTEKVIIASFNAG